MVTACSTLGAARCSPRSSRIWTTALARAPIVRQLRTLRLPNLYDDGAEALAANRAYFANLV